MNVYHSTICVVGTGYAGMACSIGFAACGHDVYGYDVIRERVRGLAAGNTPYHENGIVEALREQLASGRLHFVEELADAVAAAQFIVLTVGTPTAANGEADLAGLETAVAALGALDLRGKTVVLRSTVPPGTSDAIRIALGERATVVYSPEFLREGTALHDFLNPDRIVVGAYDRASADAYLALLAAVPSPAIVTSPREAELIKVVSNAYLALKISFANEVADLCDRVGADALVVLAAIGADRRIGTACFAPGIGFGGPCFEKDLRSLTYVSANVGAARELYDATLRTNDAQPQRIVAMLEEELGGDLAGMRIGVWGLAFKAGTDDVRHSLAIRIVDDLMQRGAQVRAFDPAIAGPHVLIRCELAAAATDVLDGDALLVLTEWPEFAAVAPATIAARLRRPVVVDGRNILDGRALAALGVRYRGVGRRAGTPARSQRATQEVAV